MRVSVSRTSGWLAILAGVAASLTLASLLLFFLGLLANIPSLSFIGGLNDALNSVYSILIALLASVPYPTMRWQAPRFVAALLAMV